MRVGGISPSQNYMEKLTKVLLILNLLHHRSVVTIDEIERICGITERSVYRYLQVISAAHFPLVYDREIHGYKLLNKDRLNVASLRLDERLMILVALELLAGRVNSFYQESIETISNRIISASFKGIEDIWQAFSSRVIADSKQDLSGLLTSLIVHSAVKSGDRLGVNLSPDGKDGDLLLVERPSLLFSEGWKVTGKGIETAVSLDKVEKVFSC